MRSHILSHNLHNLGPRRQNPLYGNNIDWKNICLTFNLQLLTTVQLFLDTVQDLFMFHFILKPTRYRGEETLGLLDLVLTDDDKHD